MLTLAQERALGPQEQVVFEQLGRAEPVLRTALQTMLVAQHCRAFLQRDVQDWADQASLSMSPKEQSCAYQRLSSLASAKDLEGLAQSVQGPRADAAESAEGCITGATAGMVREEALHQLRVGDKVVRRRMAAPDFAPSISDAAMGSVAALLECEVVLAGIDEEHVAAARECCALLMHGLEARVPTALQMMWERSAHVPDGWWMQFEMVMGAPLEALVPEALVRRLVARSLEQARDLLGAAMFAA